jgi:hypothetical protein
VYFELKSAEIGAIKGLEAGRRKLEVTFSYND